VAAIRFMIYLDVQVLATNPEMISHTDRDGFIFLVQHLILCPRMQSMTVPKS
jgi:hypothetical protein